MHLSNNCTVTSGPLVGGNEAAPHLAVAELRASEAEARLFKMFAKATDGPIVAAPPSEGVAELIERLAIAVFKRQAVIEAIEPLALQIGIGTAGVIRDLALANKDLWDLKDEQARAIKGKKKNAQKLFRMIQKDILLCEARARLRADLNARLGQAASSESVKKYG